MRKSCLISANNEDAYQSIHLMYTVGSVHATNKNEPYLAETLQSQVFSQSLKCSAQDLSVDLLDMRDTQIYTFPHQSDTFASSFLSYYVLRYQILQKTQIRLLP